MPTKPAAPEIENLVARIVASPGFANSGRLCELLRHTVAESLAGRSASLKESLLGVAVFGCKPGYDSDANSIVPRRIRPSAQKAPALLPN